MKASADSIDLNSPDRFYEIQAILKEKASLKALYLEVYQKYVDCIKRSPSNGIALEIGSGGGFAKEVIPQLVTSDIIPYPHVDRVMDATQLDFPDNSLSCICLYNVLHHIPNTPAFFREAIRCLVPGGHVFMVEPYPGWISTWVYRYLHHEGFDKKVKEWEFTSNGPVSDANNALPYVIFERDIEKFQREFPQLSIARYAPHTPLRYWMTGGLKNWSLLPQKTYRSASWLDKKLIQISPRLGSFVDIELIKI